MKAALDILQKIKESPWYPTIPVWLDTTLKDLKQILLSSPQEGASEVVTIEAGPPSEDRLSYILKVTRKDLHNQVSSFEREYKCPSIISTKKMLLDLWYESARLQEQHRFVGSKYPHISFIINYEWFMFRDPGDHTLEIFPMLLEHGKLPTFNLSIKLQKDQ